ncbi:MAG: signal recognition particle protein [Candidatus Dormibacteria bacterium]
MFDALSDRLTGVFKRFSGRGKLTAEDVEAGLREVRLALLEADVNFKVARAFIDRIRERSVGEEVLQSLTPGQHIVKIVNDELVALLGSEQRKLRYQSQPPTVIMLAGLQGSGKTTTAAKLALAIRREGHRPLLVAADIQRPAAAQQLERLGKDNQIPVVMPDGTSKPPRLCSRGVEESRRLNCDVVILDTAGRLQIDQAMLAELQEIRRRVRVSDTLLVVDAMTGQEAVNVGRAFEDAVGIDGVILTKLDGDARGGAALSMREAIGKPIMYCGVGEKPADLEPFQPERMASRILGMGDVLSLIEKAQQHVDAAEAEQTAERLFAGRFTMEDWLTQMRQVRKMGPLEGILGMLPGGRDALKQAGSAMPSETDLSRMEAIVLSMTPRERSHPEIIKGSRRKRIAMGSGTGTSDVNRLLKGFAQMQAMFRMTGGSKGSKGKGKLGQARMIRELQKSMKGIDPSQLGLPQG